MNAQGRKTALCVVAVIVLGVSSAWGVEPLRVGGLSPLGDNPLEPFDAEHLTEGKACGEVVANWTVDKGAKIVWADGSAVSPTTSIDGKKVIKVRYDEHAWSKDSFNAVTITCDPTDPDEDAKSVKRTPFEVVIEPRYLDSQDISVVTENDKRQSYISGALTQDLGVLAQLTSYITWSGGIELKGQLKPDDLRAADFGATDFDFRRWYDERVWLNNTLTDDNSNIPDDPTPGVSEDLTPSDTGCIYDYDFPGTYVFDGTPCDLLAERLKFKQYCEYTQGTATARCSNIIYWYNRTTIRVVNAVDCVRDNHSTGMPNVIGITEEGVTSVLDLNMLAPTVSGITPDTGARGKSVPITDLAGDRFVNTPTVRLKLGANTITATNVSLLSKERIVCVFAIPEDAQLGSWSVEVVNPDDQSGTRYGCFTVTE
ncbi:MAG: hypothetical protein AMS16_03245 [Planctomycetes bacterium DG_58]|nr:MAG: hypothetical protein AMS16_03245 [Planctomycetes bacterium DG_58]